jgi:glycosyltransferase involved in cell wall biosynthesis
MSVHVAVLIPCFNEAAAIADVVQSFRAALPDAKVYVYDNNSADDTSARAEAAGAIVRREARQGKGHVVRRMFADIDADIYVLVDGDGTYEAAAAPAMVARLRNENLDMVTGVRQHQHSAAYRPGHVFGNALLTGLVSRLFGAKLSDMLSGYRVFSRRFVKSFPALAGGFETETEFTVHALQLGLPTGEHDITYSERPTGSASKLRTYRDGARILRMVLLLVKDERPVPFFSVAALILLLASLGLGIPVVLEFLRTGLVPRLPTALAAASCGMLCFLSLACGLILDSVARGRREMKRLAYLAVPQNPDA